MRRKIHLDKETINCGDGKFPLKYDVWRFRIGMKSSYHIVCGLRWRGVAVCAVLLVKPKMISSIYEEVAHHPPTTPPSHAGGRVRQDGELMVVLGYCLNDEVVFSG